MGMYTAPAPGTRTGPNTVQRYPAGDPRRYANQGGVPPGSMPGKPQLVGGPVNRPIINPPPAPMPPARPMPPPQPPVGRPGGPQLIGGPVGRPIIGPPPAPMPSMPYGGPIGNPGLPPGVGIQGGLPNREDGRDPYLYGPDAGPGFGYNPGGSTTPGSGMMPQPGYGGPYTPRPDLGPNIGFGVGLPQPNFASALGTASPLLNTIRR